MNLTRNATCGRHLVNIQESSCHSANNSKSTSHQRVVHILSCDWQFYQKNLILFPMFPYIYFGYKLTGQLLLSNICAGQVGLQRHLWGETEWWWCPDDTPYKLHCLVVFYLNEGKDVMTSRGELAHSSTLVLGKKSFKKLCTIFLFRKPQHSCCEQPRGVRHSQHIIRQLLSWDQIGYWRWFCRNWRSQNESQTLFWWRSQGKSNLSRIKKTLTNSSFVANFYSLSWAWMLSIPTTPVLGARFTDGTGEKWFTYQTLSILPTVFLRGLQKKSFSDCCFVAQVENRFSMWKLQCWCDSTD